MSNPDEVNPKDRVEVLVGAAQKLLEEAIEIAKENGVPLQVKLDTTTSRGYRDWDYDLDYNGWNSSTGHCGYV